MVYRIVAESVYLQRGENSEWTYEGTGNNMRGLFRAGFSNSWGDLKLVWIDNPRARFYFTEEGWRVYGRRLTAATRRHGIIIHVRREKNPARSRIVYQDKYQIVLLPSRTRGD